LEYLEKVGEGTYKESFKVKIGPQFLALKVYKPGSVDARAVREIKVMELCNHAGIAKLQEVNEFSFEGNQYLYILEEFLSGNTLAAYLDTNGTVKREDLLARL